MKLLPFFIMRASNYLFGVCVMFFILVHANVEAQNAPGAQQTSIFNYDQAVLEGIVGVSIAILIGIIFIDRLQNRKRAEAPLELIQTNRGIDATESVAVGLAKHEEPSAPKSGVPPAVEIIKKLQEYEIGNSIMLGMIRKSLEEGRYVPKIEIDYIKEQYARLQITDKERIRWTLDVTRKLQEQRIGDPKRLNAIKKALEEEKTVIRDEVNYLKEQYFTLRKTEKEKVRWTIDTIRKIQEQRIGDPARLNVIRKALEEEREVSKDEVDYLKERYSQLVVILKGTVK